MTSLSVDGPGGVHAYQVNRCHKPRGGVPIDVLEAWAALQRDVARIEKGTARDLMKFGKDKCQALP